MKLDLSIYFVVRSWREVTDMLSNCSSSLFQVITC